MSDGLKAAGVMVLVVALCVGAAFALPALQLKVYKTFGKRFENAKTEVYRENKSYVEGSIRDLRELRVDYEAASDEHKPAIKSLILQHANELDWNHLPSDLKTFLESL